MMMMMMDMAQMAMEEGGGESGCSSTTTMDEDNMGCGWNNWNPVVDWGLFSGDDDFHGLIESMMCGDDDTVMATTTLSHKQSPCSSIPSTTTTNTNPSEAEEEVVVVVDDDKGMRLVHLLMAAAEALTGPNKSRELARVILVRLKEMVPAAAATATGTNMERLAAHFTDALQGLLDGGGACGGRQTSSYHHKDEHHHPPGDVLAAFQLLQDMSPYVKFGHFTANQAILEAVAGDRRVHVIDYDIMEGVQWASLMQAMVSRSDGLPPPHLRITAVTRGGGGGGRRGIGSTVQETGRRLAAFAASVGQPFSFGQCRLDADERFRAAGVKVVKGEALVANCVLHPPQGAQRATGSVASFLEGAAALGARVVAMVEEEAEGSGGVGFVGRFMEELHRYSAVWDSLEAGFPMQGHARGLVERVILRPWIAGAVGRAYRRAAEGAAADVGWGEWMARMGYGRVGISCFNLCQARLLLGLFNDGYRVDEPARNKLVLSWKGRRLLTASVWSAPAPGMTGERSTASPQSSDFLL